MVSNDHQWQAFNKYIDVLLSQQQTALEQSTDLVLLHRNQGAISMLRKFKLMKDEVYGIK